MRYIINSQVVLSRAPDGPFVAHVGARRSWRPENCTFALTVKVPECHEKELYGRLPISTGSLLRIGVGGRAGWSGGRRFGRGG